MRFVNSLDEFEAVLGETADLTEWERVNVLANCFLRPEKVRSVPQDPFSLEYLEAVGDIHRQISNRSNYDPQEHEKTPFDMESYLKRPPLYQGDSLTLSRFFITFGHMLSLLDIKPGMSVVEYGPGDGQFCLHLARLGCEVTVVDIEPAYLELIRRQAERLGVHVNTVQGTFETNPGKFDRVIYFEAFHHCLNHGAVLEMLRDVVTEGGLIVFGQEPIIEIGNYWINAVPYPWGPRLDGVSLRAMMVHGWMELGFQEPYLSEVLSRTGWQMERHSMPVGGHNDTYVARKL
jgi:SAM-dependent methyltransferase